MSLLLTPETGQACDDLHRARTEYLSVLSCSEVVSMVIDSGRLVITLKGGNTVSQELSVANGCARYACPTAQGVHPCNSYS